MWLVLSLVSATALIIMLLAGLLWPLLWHSSQEKRWFSSWWHYWLYITAPLLSWRHKQRLQHLVVRTGQSAALVEIIFAYQCLAFVVTLSISLLILWWLGVSPLHGLPVYTVLSILMYWYPVSLLHSTMRQQQQQLQRDFPFMLDLLTLSIEAGMGILSALQVCISQLPPHALRLHLQTTLDDLRTGLNREQAFARFAERTDLDEAHAFVSALQQSFELGGSLGPLLRQQAERRRQERFLRAEKKALEAPVKMLLPLVVCIFPCTFLVIGYPLFFQLAQNL